MQNKIEQIELRTHLEQITEECGELTQACMKLIRAMGNGNPCSVSEEEAIDKVVEEFADVMVAGNYLMDRLNGMTAYPVWMRINDISAEKEARWNKRLEEYDAKQESMVDSVSNHCDGDSCDITSE